MVFQQNLLSIEAHDEGDAGCGVSWLEFHPSYHESSLMLACIEVLQNL